MIKNDEIHLWIFNFSTYISQINIFESYLSKEELEVAKRFIAQSRQIKFKISRGILKKLLSYYLDQDIHKIQISVEPNGKPFLNSDSLSLCFNLAHSEDVVIYAFSSQHIGVDVEYLRAIEIDKMKPYLFSENEQRILTLLDREQRNRYFFKVWTCKEAFLKGLGIGLNYLPSKIEIVDLPCYSKIFFTQPQMRDKNLEASKWTIRLIENIPGYIGALAVKNMNKNYQLIYKANYHLLDMSV